MDFGFHKDKSFFKADSSFKKSEVDRYWILVFLLDIEKELTGLLDFWILIDSLFINQLLTQRCDGLKTCARAKLTIFRYEVFTDEKVICL